MLIMVTLPTYNEAQNIGDLMDDLLALRPDLQIVVIDDDSPDGTYNIVREKAAATDRVRLIHRKGRRGRGSAGIEGFQYALKSGADLIVEMDADYSHHPRFIPAMICRAEEGADVVIGSRLVRGGGETGRSFLRTLITHAANFYIRIVLGLTVRDCTSGYRVFRRRALDAISLDTLQSNGPAIVQEVLLRCKRKGFLIVEEPILFEERRAGTSTFNTRIMLAGLWSVLMFRFKS